MDGMAKCRWKEEWDAIPDLIVWDVIHNSMPLMHPLLATEEQLLSLPLQT